MTERTADPAATPASTMTPFSLPQAQDAALAGLFEGEQLFHQLGIRGIVTGAASGDTAEFTNAAEKLKRVLVTQFAAGQAMERENSFPALCAYLGAGFIFGVAATLGAALMLG